MFKVSCAALTSSDDQVTPNYIHFYEYCLMQVPNLKLSADPLALVRKLPTQLVPIDQLKANPNLAKDEIFLAKYTAFLHGRTPIHETRLSLNNIRCGFWRRRGNWELDGDVPTPSDIASIVRSIRLGGRPVLHLYESPNPADTFRFVCTDDVVVHAAYTQLGIAKVPVALMCKPRDLEESCLSIRNFSKGRGKFLALIEGVVPVESKLVPSVLGSKKPEIVECFSRLRAALLETKEAVRDFHLPGSTSFHYHHTLYSVLIRAEDCLESMRLLVAAGKPLVAAGLLRSLHELALVFYVDWLSPATTYRYLQAASVMNEKQWDELCSTSLKEDLAAGASALEAKNIKDAQMRGFRLGSVVGERARIFPLGQQLQRDIYSFLSDVIHHDFSMTARYAFTLDHGDEAVFHEGALDTILHLSDILVAAIVSRIQDDIGDAPALISQGR